MSVLGRDQRLEEMTVNQIIGRHPASVAVFNRMGIDACCVGAALVRTAVERDGVDAEALLAALDEAFGR